VDLSHRAAGIISVILIFYSSSPYSHPNHPHLDSIQLLNSGLPVVSTTATAAASNPNLYPRRSEGSGIHFRAHKPAHQYRARAEARA
jgi:hypothetical protein